MRTLMALSLCLFLAGSAAAQCSGGKCRVAPAAPAPVVTRPAEPAPNPIRLAPAPTLLPEVNWKYADAEKTRVELHVGGFRRGTIDLAAMQFTEESGAVWQSWKPDGVVPAGQFGQLPPDGVRWRDIPHDGRDHYTVNGEPSDARRAMAAIGDPSSAGLPDDAKWPTLTVIGAAADRDRVLGELRGRPEFASIKLKGFEPGHRFAADYGPGLIHLQAPNGRPLLAVADYPGADAVAAKVKAAVAGYDPAKDPGPGKPYPVPEPPCPCEKPLWPWFATAAFVALFLFTRPRS